MTRARGELRHDATAPSLLYGVMALAVGLTLPSSAAEAQGARCIDQLPVPFEKINNDSIPTLLTTQAGIQYQLNQITGDSDVDLWASFFTKPFR